MTISEFGICMLIVGILLLWMWFSGWMQKVNFEQKKQPAMAVLMSAPQIQGEEAILSVWLPALQKPNKQNRDTYQCYIPAMYVQYLQQQFPVFYTKSHLMFGIPTLRIEVQGMPAPTKNTRNTARMFCLVAGILLLLFGIVLMLKK